MSDFVVELRKDLSEDFDTNDFVAELHPPRVSFDTDDPEEMASDCSDIPAFASDEYVQGLLSNNKFSTEEMTEMLQSSILTLIKKFLFGRSIAEIGGQIEIRLHDDQKSPITINFNTTDQHIAPSPCYDNCSPAADTSDELNIRIRGVSHETTGHPQCTYRNCSPSPELSRASSLSPHLQVRRESDADSGYGGKKGDEMEIDDLPRHYMNRQSSEYAAAEERIMCPSVDNLSTMLESDMRYKREPSCEKATAGFASPSSEPEYSDTCDELNDGVYDLIIDESVDEESQMERPFVPDEQDKTEGSDVRGKQDAARTSLSLRAFQAQPCADRDASSQLDSPGIPSDLSEDSENPQGSFESQALCYKVSSQRLECRLCYAIMDNDEDFMRHTQQTHCLFTCPQCFQSFTASAHLEKHAHSHAVNGNLQMTILTERHSERDSTIRETENSFQVNHAKGQTFQREDTGKESSRPHFVVDQDETYGQLLDLSMKKTTGTPEGPSDCANQNKTLFNRPGENVSRNGYGQPSQYRFAFNAGANTEPYHAHIDKQSQSPPCHEHPQNKENTVVSIKTEPLSGAPQTYIEQGTDNRALQLIPCKTEISEYGPNTDDAAHIKKHFQRKIVHRSFSNTQGKTPLRFSPYSRERLAELAAKFLASRREASACNHGPERKKTSPSSATADSLQRPQPPRPTCETALTEVNGGSSRRVSLSETTLKNRVNAFVKNGGHQAHSAASHVSGHINTGNAPKQSSVDHAMRSRADGSFTCSHEGCGEDFACFQALERHSVEIHGRYLCEHCGKTFTARPNRDRHVRYHTGERPYKCDLCPMAFFRGDDLKYHRTTRHPAAEPFVCSHCNRNFTWSKDLEKHQRHGRCKA